MKKYVSDFETAKDNNDNMFVWEYAVVTIEEDPMVVSFGNNIDSFFNCMIKNPGEYYFHNAKFDAEYLISYLYNKGYKYTENKELKENEFCALYSDSGEFYNLKICFKAYSHKKISVSIKDSLKVIPMSVDKIPKAFGLNDKKLKENIDHKKQRNFGYIPTEEEKEYVIKDCVIVAKALHQLFEMGLTKLTIASNAFSFFKKDFSKNEWDRLFPEPVFDYDIRQAFKGGWTFVKKDRANKDIGEGLVLDCNGLYSYVMKHKKLPYGEGKLFYGKYEEDKVYDLYIQMIRCEFKLKPGKLPTIQLKNSLFFCENEYIEETLDEPIVLYLTNIDLELFFDSYDVYDIEYIRGWKYKSKTGIFDKYIDYWAGLKAQATIDGNKGLRTISKLMLNALFGKFAIKPKFKSKVPYLKGDGSIGYAKTEEKERNAIYVPMGVFITSYGRDITIRAAVANYDRFLYADTDSLHLSERELPCGLNIDDVELGAWKIENTFSRARYIKPKCYIEDVSEDFNEKLIVRCSGMPESCHKYVTWDNFRLGQSYDGKLAIKHGIGGVELIDTKFTIMC